MNGYREENSNSFCYFHPKQALLGVCPLCLNERLLILAAKPGRPSSTRRAQSSSVHKKPPITLPKIFALGSFLSRRLEFRHWKSDNSDDHDHDLDLYHDASTSQEALEESFISIKFEENGVASWEKSTVVCKKASSTVENYYESKEAKETKTVIEHGKPRVSLRWRKRIGHVFQLIRWKRSNKGNVCHVGSKVEGVKVRKGWWIRTLTKRKAAE